MSLRSAQQAHLVQEGGVQLNVGAREHFLIEALVPEALAGKLNEQPLELAGSQAAVHNAAACALVQFSTIDTSLCLLQ